MPPIMKRYTSTTVFLIILLFFTGTVFPQLSVDITLVQNNSTCIGDPCYYEGPSILINEVMQSPNSIYDGCIFGYSLTPGDCQGEWIELYNPNPCEPVDISCYFMGNAKDYGSAGDPDYFAGGFTLPETPVIIPPLGFCVIRGVNAEEIDPTLLIQNGGNTYEYELNDPNKVCMEETRLWFPNAGGWFAFYDNNGVMQDAIKWATESGVGGNPCIATNDGCPYEGTLESGDENPQCMSVISTVTIPDSYGLSFQRAPDGGPWQTDNAGVSSMGDCNGDCNDIPEVTCDGEATAVPSGGTPPYYYEWDYLNQLGATISGLCEGEYCVTITDAQGNTATDCIYIYNADDPVLIMDSTMVTCYGYADGTAHVDINTNNEPSEVIWSNSASASGVTSHDISNLGPGTYIVTVTDAGFCTAIDTVTITEPPQLIISVGTDTTICDYESADIFASVSGGIPPYSYQWDNGLGSGSGDNSAHTISPGLGNYGTTVYNITFTDSNGCQITDDVTITSVICDCETPPVPFNIIQPPCCGDNVSIEYAGPGLGTVSGVDLIDPEYTWDIGSVTLISGTLNGSGVPGTLVVSPPGCGNSYDITLTVQNHEGVVPCYPASHTETIVVPSQVVIDNQTGSSVPCFGDPGTITITASGGTGSLDYEISTNPVTSQGNGSFSGLPAGTYTITITDDNECSVTTTETVTEPDLLTTTAVFTDLLCFGDANGTITLTPSGGTLPYSYYNGITTNNDGYFNGLSGGDYTVTVTDYNGCDTTVSGYINEPPPIVVDEPVTTDILCYGDDDGIISVTASGGTGILTYSTDIYINQTGYFTGLDSDDYTIIIEDENNCTETVTATINEPPELTLTISSDTVCIDEITSVTVYPSGGTPEYTYLWNNYETTQSVTDIPGVTTSYSVVVTDANNCVKNISTTVFVYPPLAITIYPDDTICAGDPATIYATYSGGMGEPYTLTLINSSTVIQTPYTVYPPITTTYTVCIDDNCPTPQACDDLEIVVMPDPPVDFLADIYEGCEPLTVHFDEINLHEGQTYHWDFNDPWGSTNAWGKNPTHTFDNPGIYDVSCIVTSQYGCTSTYTWHEMISVWANPVAAFLPYPQVATILEPVIFFENNSSTFFITNWTFGDGDSSNVIHPQHYYPGPGTYPIQLAVETEHGCVDTTWSDVVIQDIITFYAPTAFSPDFDQMNGLFSPIGHGIDPDYWHLMIYDRWGEKVWETYVYDANEETGEVYNGWDGTVRDKKIGETAVYGWLVIYRDVTGAEHQESGLVTLIR